MRSKKEKVNALLESLRRIFTTIQAAKTPLIRLTQKKENNYQTIQKKSTRKNKKTSKYAREFYARKRRHKDSSVNTAKPETVNVSPPKITIPKITIPKVSLPKISAPRISLPKISVPKILSKIAISKITVPKFSSVSKFKPADFKVPRITIPKIKPVNFKIPKFSLSQLKNSVNLSSLPGKFKNSRAGIAAVAALALVILAGGLVVANTEKKAFVVLLDGKQVALVENRQEAEQALAKLKAEKAKIWNRNVAMKETLTFRETEARLYKIDDITDLTEILDNKITFVAAATGIKIDGKVSLVVKDVQTAEALLKKLKESFINSDFKISSVRFAETVEIVPVPANLKEIIESEKAFEIILNGRQKKVTHVVAEGDSLWLIARKYDMHVADLKAANLDLKGEKLDLGQELSLVRVEPMINVLAEGQITLNETLPYDVVVEKDGSMWRGRQKIKQKGKDGAREVTYKVVLKNGTEVSKLVLAEKVLKQPTDQVVVKGSRLVVASRGGSGRVGWPTGGRITSGYGRRWGRMHTGIDIDGHTGQPIGAAAGGRVISTGWDGGYGKTVVISHGGGLVTKYAHLSKIDVEVGQEVSRGDLIGAMGNTGRSTGSHLHFEVIVGGSFQNPMRYLR